MNTVVLVGRLTRDPELRKTPNNTSTVSFNLAVDRGFKNENGEKEADFIPCVAWKGIADFISQYLKKGSLVALNGSIRTRNYKDKDGKTIYVTEVLVNQLASLEKKDKDVVKGKVSGGTFDIPVEPTNELIIEDKDLPFY